MKQEIFYKELENLDKVDILTKEYLSGEDKEELRDYVRMVSNKIDHSETTVEEIKIFVAAIYLNKSSVLRNNFITAFSIPDNIENYNEFIVAVIFKGFRDGFGNPLSSFNVDLFNIKFNSHEEVMDRLIEVVTEEDLKLIQNNVFKFLGNYEELLKKKYFPNYEINLENVNFLYNSDRLKTYSELANIEYERMNLFRRIISIPYEISGYHRSFISAVTMLFKLAKVTTPLTDDEYKLLAVFLNQHSFKEYEYSLASEIVDGSVEDEFRKLCKAYLNLINSKSKSVITNRLNKILHTTLSTHNRDLDSNDYLFGYMLKNEVLNFEGSKMFNKIIVELSL